MNVNEYVGRAGGFRTSMETLIKNYNLKTIRINPVFLFECEHIKAKCTYQSPFQGLPLSSYKWSER